MYNIDHKIKEKVTNYFMFTKKEIDTKHSLDTLET